MVGIKEGAELDGVTHHALRALAVAAEVYDRHEADCVLTSAKDGTHSERSLHYSGNAIDIRTRNLPASGLSQVAQEIQYALGKDFDVVIESDHIHIEYDPKK